MRIRFQQPYSFVGSLSTVGCWFTANLLLFKVQSSCFFRLVVASCLFSVSCYIMSVFGHYLDSRWSSRRDSRLVVASYAVICVGSFLFRRFAVFCANRRHLQLVVALVVFFFGSRSLSFAVVSVYSTCDLRLVVGSAVTSFLFVVVSRPIL